MAGVEVSFGEQTSRADRSALKFFRTPDGDDLRPSLGWPPSRDPRGARWLLFRGGRGAAWVGQLVLSPLVQGRFQARGQVKDVPNEFTRLVVVRGDPGSTASTVPHELDARLRTPGTTVVADGEPARLLLTVTGTEEAGRTWEAAVSRVEMRLYGGREAALSVTFVDGSWLRLDADDTFALADTGKTIALGLPGNPPIGSELL